MRRARAILRAITGNLEIPGKETLNMAGDSRKVTKKLPELFRVFESNANILCPDDHKYCSPEIGICRQVFLAEGTGVIVR